MQLLMRLFGWLLAGAMVGCSTPTERLLGDEPLTKNEADIRGVADRLIPAYTKQCNPRTINRQDEWDACREANKRIVISLMYGKRYDEAISHIDAAGVYATKRPGDYSGLGCAEYVLSSDFGTLMATGRSKLHVTMNWYQVVTIAYEASGKNPQLDHVVAAYICPVFYQYLSFSSEVSLPREFYRFNSREDFFSDLRRTQGQVAEQEGRRFMTEVVDKLKPALNNVPSGAGNSAASAVILGNAEAYTRTQRFSPIYATLLKIRKDKVAYGAGSD